MIFLALEWDGYGTHYNAYNLRTDRWLIKCIEKLGDKANGECSALKIVGIPDGAGFMIKNNDGLETLKTVFDIYF